MADRRLQLPEVVVPGHRLGRHVRHDPRSLRYLVPEATTPVTAMWRRQVPVWDQGDTGSCTGQAAAGALGTSPLYETLAERDQQTIDEAEALDLYSAATSLDEFPGTYPPDDTGSSGLAVAKACKARGLISGYQHITSIPAAQEAIKQSPFITGVAWYSSMDHPTATGLVTVSGTVRGGHEFVCHGYSAEADLWWFTNSWGPSYGDRGRFCMTSASYGRLLAEDGDATVLIPLTQPAPLPTPAPESAGTTVTFTADQLAALDAWGSSPHGWRKATAAAKAWGAATR